MARIYRIDIENENCWKCDHFRKNNGSGATNEGTCCANAPRARGAFTGGTAGTDQDLAKAAIPNPSTTWCGEFKVTTFTREADTVVIE